MAHELLSQSRKLNKHGGLHTFGELKLKILPQKCVFYLGSKLTSQERHPPDVTLGPL